MKAWKGAIFSVAILLLTNLVRYKLGFKADFYITGSLYFILTVFVIKLFKVQDPKKFCIYEVLAILVLHLFGATMDSVFAEEPFTLIPYFLVWPNFAYYFIAIFLAYCFVAFPKRRVLTMLTFLLPMLAYWQYSPYLFRYANFATYSSNINEVLPQNLVVYDHGAQPHKIETKNGRYLVLDFWFSKCAPCFEAFPELEKLYKAQKNSIDIMCINSPIDDDAIEKFSPFQSLKDRGYTFPVFVADTSLAEKLSVQTFPTILLIKDNEIIFRGSIEDLNERFEFY